MGLGFEAKQGFPCGSAAKGSACNARDLGLIPGLGRSPGEGKGYPLQYSGLENTVDCIVHGVTKSQTRLSDFHFQCSSRVEQLSLRFWKASELGWGEPQLFLKEAVSAVSRVLYVLDDYEVDWSNSSSPTSGSGAPLADKEKSWLYTLDPILITIIAMSSLGVLLGATCAGLLLYCTCSYSGLSSRSCTTLENYNFELYDGLKHKVKMNHQKCCSEAWQIAPRSHLTFHSSKRG